MRSARTPKGNFQTLKNMSHESSLGGSVNGVIKCERDYSEDDDV